MAVLWRGGHFCFKIFGIYVYVHYLHFMKAKSIGKARELKTWRVDPDLLKKLAAYCKKKKKPETEVLEVALYDYISR